MSFSRVKPGSWAFGERLASGELNALDADHANAIDGVAGGTYNPTSPIVIGGSGLTLNASLVINSDLTIGNSTSDDLVVEATALFNGPATFDGVATFSDTATFSAASSFTSDLTIGNSSADTCTVTATLVVNNSCTIGSTSGDTLTVNASTTFNGPISFGDALVITGTVEMQNDVTLGTNASDLIDVLGRFRLGRALEYQNSGSGIGRAPFRFGTLEADDDQTLTVADGQVFKIPLATTNTRTCSLGTTSAVDGDWFLFFTGANATNGPAFDYLINSPTANQDATFAFGTGARAELYVFSGGGWYKAITYA